MGLFIYTECFEHGYKIPLESIPPKLQTTITTLENKEFVSKAIQEILNKNLIVQCNEIPHIIAFISGKEQNKIKTDSRFDSGLHERTMRRTPLESISEENP